MKMADPRPTFAYLTTALRDKHLKLAYLHVTEPRVAGNMDIVTIAGEDNDFLREIWNSGEGGEARVFISAGGYTRDTALHTAEEKGGLVAFGRQYISNVRAVAFFWVARRAHRLDYKPDLPVRLQKNVALTAPDRSKYYLTGNLTPLGYNDWPFADGTVTGIDGRL